MTERLSIDPAVGDAILASLESYFGEQLDIIMIIGRPDDWSRPSFVTSIHPSLMEHILVQITEFIQSGQAGEAIIDGTFKKES